MSENKFDSLNELGCIDEMNIRLTKLNGVLVSLENSADKIDDVLIRSVLWTAIDMVQECKDIADRTSNLLPRR